MTRSYTVDSSAGKVRLRLADDAPRIIEFTVPGIPTAKGRPRAVRTKSGKIACYTPRKTERYESLVRDAYLAQVHDSRPHDGPVSISVKAYFPVPKSRPKKWRELAEGEAVPHVSRPDADNILKVVVDALNGIAFRDDRLVWWQSVQKRYSDTPRVEVSLAFGVGGG